MNDQSGATVVGNTVKVGFVAFNRSAEGKVDTGATTSSLHATNIQVDQRRNRVSFNCDVLSSNVITLPLEGTQEVHSADAGGVSRPMVALDVTIDGKPIKGATFNLNDRGSMDTKILIGQNILQAAEVMIDPSQGKQDQPQTTRDATGPNEAAILAAVEVLVENNVSLAELVKYLRTVAINRIED
jgi:hypothetical protein